MNVNEKIKALRTEMKRIGVQAYIIPSADAHLSEYVATHWQGRAYLSGFTGSAGTLVVTETESGLWTDGRYFIQAESELAGSEVQLFKMGQSGVPTITEYLANTLQEGSCVGIDGKGQGFLAKSIYSYICCNCNCLVFTKLQSAP